MKCEKCGHQNIDVDSVMSERRLISEYLESERNNDAAWDWLEGHCRGMKVTQNYGNDLHNPIKVTVRYGGEKYGKDFSFVGRTFRECVEKFVRQRNAEIESLRE